MATACIDSSRLTAGRENSIPDGLAGPHPGHPDAGQVKAQDPAEGTVGEDLHRSRHQLALPVG